MNLKKLTPILLGCVLLSAFAGKAQALNILVQKSEDTFNASNCTPQNQTQCSLREAIQLSNITPGTDTIQLTGNNYKLTRVPNGPTLDIAAGDLDITDSVIIKSTSLKTIDANKIDRAFEIKSSAKKVTFENLFITRGLAQSGDGGAILADGESKLVLNDCFVIDSSTKLNVPTNGGGIAFIGESLELNRSAVLNNVSPAWGGGLYLQSQSSKISNSFIQNNTSLFRQGGGIFISMGQAEIQNSEISKNKVFSNGADPFGGLGGGIYANFTTLDISGSTLAENFAPRQGGAIYNEGSDLRLTNSTLSSNKVGNGLEVSRSQGSAIFINAPIDTNRTTTLANTTVAGNDAPGFNAAIFNSNGILSLARNVLGNQKQGVACAASSDAFTESLGGNVASLSLFSCNLGTADLKKVDPMLGGLAFNGGLTRTHALLEGSPAIDFLDASVSIPDVDQRGLPRDSQPDSGAYEFQQDSEN